MINYEQDRRRMLPSRAVLGRDKRDLVAGAPVKVFERYDVGEQPPCWCDSIGIRQEHAFVWNEDALLECSLSLAGPFPRPVCTAQNATPVRV